MVTEKKEMEELGKHAPELLVVGVAVVKGSLVTRSVTTKLEVVSDYIIDALCSDEVREKAHEIALRKVFERHTVVGICVNTIAGMPNITYALLDEETGYNPVPDHMSEDVSKNFQLCYVLNTKALELSEYGDCFFEKRKNGTIHRVS